jgi:hypothetical protein
MHLMLVVTAVVVVWEFFGIIISVCLCYRIHSITSMLLLQRGTLTLGDLHVFTGRHN